MRVTEKATPTLATSPKVILRKLSVSSSQSLFKNPSSPRRSFSSRVDPESELFNYTSGRWVYNDALRLQERRLVFDVDGFMQLAAKSVDRLARDIISSSKLSEGRYNRIFLITFNDSFQMVARVPYPLTVPKYYAVASEVATMEYLRLSGLPVPEVYGYCPSEENGAGTAYIFMEYAQGSSLEDMWLELKDEGIANVIRQVTQLEGRMTALPFPAGGSLYFVKDLEKVGIQGVPVPENERFCVGPDTKESLWYGRRGKLDVDRGPYTSIEHALVAGAHKELAFLKQFGRPLLPIRRERRPPYDFKPQQPSDHIQNLERYLSIASSLIPKDLDLHRFSIAHPYPDIRNLIIDRDGQITMPKRSLRRVPPSGDTEGPNSLYGRQLMEYHYVKNSERFNELHHRAFADPLHPLRLRLFKESCAPWQGETLQLKAALLETLGRWAEVKAGSASSTCGSQCPYQFDEEDIAKTAVLCIKMVSNINGFEGFQTLAGGIGNDGWVPVEKYDEARVVLELAQRAVIRHAAETSEEWRQAAEEHWLFNDMDEEEYR
ncbi:hypothetical protein BKA70DRAFT_1575498 [Coprinopsis sp. MPI-PUGE-AT-0042]|nr:hypothetical protein BKA70DRAFT_1575498 [Coprinopsis sp. MPI-PUGE-AT-0042]